MREAQRLGDGHPVDRINDIGVAGIHRLFSVLERLRAATALIVVALLGLGATGDQQIIPGVPFDAVEPIQPRGDALLLPRGASFTRAGDKILPMSAIGR